MLSHPKAVVFDVGHVLYDWDPRYLYQKLIDDGAALDVFLSEIVTKAWHYQHDEGRAFADTSAELVARFPQHRPLIEVYGPRWLETIGAPMPGMAELVQELAAAQVPLFAITNFSAEFWAMFRPTVPLFDLFTDVVVSGAERLVKPDPAIYALAQARFGLGPADAVFIDDNAANVAGAEAAGWFAHRFESEVGAREALRAHGFPVSPALAALAATL